MICYWKKTLAFYTKKSDWTVRERLWDDLPCEIVISCVFQSLKYALTDGFLTYEISVHCPQHNPDGYVCFYITRGWGWNNIPPNHRWREDLFAACEKGLLRLRNANEWRGQFLQLSSSKTHIFKIYSDWFLFVGVILVINDNDQMLWNFEPEQKFGKGSWKLAVHFATFKAVSIFTLTACKCVFFFSNWKKALVFVYIVWFVYFYKTKKPAARCPSLISFKVVLSL